jgi:protein-S-isoprenylcysteine O-methyltransferase Ste14
MDYIVLALLWVGWCTLHSLMITESVTAYLKDKLGYGYRFYRIIFNLVALVTLISVISFSLAIRKTPVFSYDGYLVIVQIVLLLGSVFFFIAGARHYDLQSFLGIRQIRTGSSHVVMSESGGLDISGIMGMTRHPWYLATILFIWADFQTIFVANLISNLILTAYLIVGTILEERKLVREFGDEYRRYQQQVPMLVPYRIFSRGYQTGYHTSQGE